MKKDEFLEILEKYPNLTSEGFGVNMEYSDGFSRKGYFALRRDELKRQLENFELCVDWLDKNPHLEGKRNAHYWKDRVQDAYRRSYPGYFHIPRGVFILAALCRGYEVTRMRGGTDAWVCEGGNCT
jgi:hypothetical protein